MLALKRILAKKDPAMAARIRTRLLAEGKITREMIESYVDAYARAYGEDLDAYIEEIVADAYAGMNRTDYGTNQLRTDVTMDVGQWKKKTGSARAPPAKYSIEKTTENRPFVEVEQDILDGVPESEWVSTVKENLKKKFPNGITVGNNEIKIDGKSRQEMTYSRYMQWLYNNDPEILADKLRATDNADEILNATTDWINEGLNHPRKDRIVDFARGNVLLRVGSNDYTADVVVGARKNGSLALYDVLNLRKTSFTKREADAAISTNPSPGAARNTASVSKTNIRSGDETVKTKFSASAEQAQAEQQTQQEDEKKKGRYRDLMGEKPATFSYPMYGLSAVTSMREL